MREIKFRAWMKSDKRMITDTQEFIHLIVTNKGVMKLQPQYEEDYYAVIPKQLYELMTSTGLFDKNGKEIYEGDIVSIPIYKPMPVGKVTDSLYKVVWNDDEARFDYIGEKNLMGTPCCSSGNQNITEVIGNIYENPELLESEV